MGKKFDFDFVPFSHDQIQDMSEDDLYKNIMSFKRRIREAYKAGKDTHPYEVEFCYLDHERMMRDRTRKFQDRRRNRKFERTERTKNTGR